MNTLHFASTTGKRSLSYEITGSELPSAEMAFAVAARELNAQRGYPPKRAIVGIEFAKALFATVAGQTKIGESEFIAAVEKGQVKFNRAILQAGWL